MKPIRNSAKAIIIRDGKLLAIELRDAGETWYILPGGGQDPGETLTEALSRECLEETGAAVKVGRLAYIREYIGRNHEFAGTDSETHTIDFMFSCAVPDGYDPAVGHLPDTGQIAVRWLPIQDLISYSLYPLSLRPILMDNDSDTTPVYLGDVN